MPKDKKMWDNILTVIMSLLCLLWIYPIVLILQNSLKIEGTFTTSTVFKLPTAETFAGLSNYIYGVTKMGFLSSLGYSLVITVSSVALILLCCSMTGWYLTRVNNKLSKFMNLLIVFSMVVPFQMVMFTLSKTADTLKLNTPWNICIIYLGFGAGLAVFMFTGFMKSVPIEIEEAAMIDGCNPLQTFFGVVMPILKPTAITVAILNAMWIWNAKDKNIATRREILLGANQYPNFTEVAGKELTEAAVTRPVSEGNTLAPYRGSMAFEAMRLHVDRSGKAPKAFMLTCGSLAMARARAQFSCNFFACAGIKVIDNTFFKSIEEGVKAALESKAEIVVVCASDDDYAEAAPKVKELLGDKAILVVAGAPACMPELEAQGIKNFINVKSNVLETLKFYLKEMGI